jgi:hypothetical protein
MPLRDLHIINPLYVLGIKHTVISDGHNVPVPDDRLVCSTGGLIIYGRKPKFPEKSCPSVNLFATIHTFTTLRLSPVLCSEKFATDRLSCGMSNIHVIAK